MELIARVAHNLQVERIRFKYNRRQVTIDCGTHALKRSSYSVISSRKVITAEAKVGLLSVKIKLWTNELLVNLPLSGFQPAEIQIRTSDSGKFR
jgi:hypothetical protein